MEKYNTQNKTKEHLLYEAKIIKELTMHHVIEIGLTNIGRWKHIADTFVSFGMVKPDYNLDGFIYNPNPPTDYTPLKIALSIIAVILFLTIFNNISTKRLNTKLKSEIEEKELVQEELKAINENLENLVKDEVEKRFEAEMIFRAIFENSPIGIVVIDFKNMKINPNGTFLKMLKYEFDEISQMNFLDLVCHEDFTSLKEDFVFLLDKKYISINRHICMNTKDKELIDLNIYAKIIKNEHTFADKILVVCEDITQKLKIEQKQKEHDMMMFQQSKMAMMGEMIGSIGHQWKQPLNVLILMIVGLNCSNLDNTIDNQKNR
ncbi:MAG: PAS domain S-box protein [Campylobacterales bacterium]|nr:PAS domain S-box protein [Campylobacterales bacterium]